MRNQWNEFFVVNFIALGYIAFTLLAQFGIHIKVDQGVTESGKSILSDQLQAVRPLLQEKYL